MSKAFTKDDDAPDAPVVLPRRPPLPAGAPNYVTARGLERLKQELATERQRLARPNASDGERARENALHAARLAELELRVAGAVLVESRHQPKDEVRFGATVCVEDSGGKQRLYRIVGVDEAN